MLFMYYILYYIFFINYLMKYLLQLQLNYMIRNLVLLCLVVIGAMSASRAPTPYCMAHQYIDQAPLSYGERYDVKLDNMFSGYNLDLNVIGNTTFAKITKKLQQIDKKGAYLPNIISHQVEHNGNDWGKQAYILYQDMTGTYIFNYGTIKSQTSVPELDFTVIVTSDKTVKCFGAALLLDFGLAIIDCMKQVQNSTTPYQNYFYYIDLAKYNVSKIVKNSMYVKYKQITKRKTMKYRDIETGYQYLLRVYPADGVNIEQRGNTYMEIFSIHDPYDIQIMKVIDRTYLHVPQLAITDAKVYLGDIFFLDYLHGLYRLDILHNNDVLITGRYIKDGFHRFAVYSDDLQDQVLIALANSHAVYEIDWSNIRDPVMINKYSLMEHSRIKQLLINDLFVIVQSAANATNDTNPNFEIDYTWIFSRGSRTFTNAYGLINHNSSKVELEFNRANDRLLVADETGVSLYQINEPILSVALSNSSKIGTSEDITIVAKSSDPNTKDTFTCQYKITFHFVRNDDLTIYKQNIPTTPKYTSNYPGLLHIELDRYVMGPNITYNLVNKTAQHQIPQNWVDKVNLTRLVFNESVHIGDVIFFHTQVVPGIAKNRIIYYVQDSQYYTHIIECAHIWEQDNVTCRQQGRFVHSSQIVSFTTAWFPSQQGNNYYYFIVFQQDLKTIRIIDYTRQHPLYNLTYFGHQQAEVSSLASSNGYLYVLRGAVKTIDVYKLSDLQSTTHFRPRFRIDAETLKPFGINYFAPQQIVTDGSHPEVLFIRCKGSLLILDIDNQDKMIVLDQIISEATSNKFYRIAVNKRNLIIVSDPDIIDVYSLDHVYIKNQVKYLRRLPIYNYKIQPTGDIQFSDFDTLIYINAVDPSINASVILIYRTDRPAAASLYHTLPLRKLYTRPGLEIEVSGFYVDFLNIKTDDGFQLYRVYSHPNYVVKDTWLDFKFNLQFTNQKSNLTSSLIQIQTVNYPSGFNSTTQLNKTLSNLKLDNQGNYTWDDRKWFVGHVVGYNFSCDECGENETSKVHLKQHVDPMRTLPISSYDYAETLQGGISVSDDLFRWRINGSIHDVINLPDQKYLERCQKVAAAYHTELVVTACQELGRGINLYVTSQSSSKPWTFGPYRSTAYNARNLQITGDIVMLADTIAQPQFKFQKGQVFLYSLEPDDQGEFLDELEVIDENDLLMAQGYTKTEAYIGNAHLIYSNANNCYRLYVTEIDNGLFVVDFTHQLGRREINILTINYIDMNELLHKQELFMPDDAIYQAVSFGAFKYNPHFQTQTVIVTTKGYHNFQVYLVYDEKSNIISKYIYRVFMRYGFYKATNEVKTAAGYVAISYIIPYEQQRSSNYTRQLVAVYDTRDYDDDHEKSYSHRYMLGAVRHNKTAPLIFAFNTTYDFHTNGTRIGLVVTNPYDVSGRNMQELSLSRNLTLQMKGDFKSQTLTLIPYSDFEVRTFQLQIINYGKSESILTIIIIILAVLITVGFAIYIFILVRNKKKRRNDQERVSLLTESESIRNSVEPTAGEYNPPVIVPPAAGVQGEESSSQQDDEEDQNQDIIESSPKAQVVAIKQTTVPVKQSKEEEKKIQSEPQVKKQQLQQVQQVKTEQIEPKTQNIQPKQQIKQQTKQQPKQQPKQEPKDQNKNEGQ